MSGRVPATLQERKTDSDRYKKGNGYKRMSGQHRKKEKPDAVCKKGDELVLEIENMGAEGEGIGRVRGYTLFIKDALVGDVVRVQVLKTEKRYGYARLLEVLQQSPWRVQPVCDVARQCGGCQIQHCSYEKQLEWKMQKVADCITRIGKIPVCIPQDIDNESACCTGKDMIQQKAVVMEPILSMEQPFYYRNKAQYPVGYDKQGKLVAGFYASRTHSIIPCTDCVIQHPCNQGIVDTVLSFMEQYGVTAYREKEQTGLVRHILIRVGRATGQVMVCLVIHGKKMPHADELVRALLACPLKGLQHHAAEKSSGLGTEPESEPELHMASICLNHNLKNTNVILGENVTCLYGQPYIEDDIGDIRYRISPISFYQVNPEQTKKLYDTALEFADLKGTEVVWDLYCGIGTISLFLAKKAARVCGVEIVPQAVADARENAALNGFDNVEFFEGAAETVVPQQYKKSRGTLQADVVTLDPPRKGCGEELLDTVVKMSPKRIVYVSCNPATLARDLKYLCSRGYELTRVRGCDMFGHSAHVETVCLLSKLHSDHHIEVELKMMSLI